MSHMEDKHMNHALCELFLSPFLPENQRTFGEEVTSNPNIKIQADVRALLEHLLQGRTGRGSGPYFATFQTPDSLLYLLRDGSSR